MEEEITNPISLKARGSIYILGIVASGLLAPTTAALVLLGYSDWVIVATAVIGAVTGTASILGRTNLSDPASLSEPLPEPLTILISEGDQRTRKEIRALEKSAAGDAIGKI